MLMILYPDFLSKFERILNRFPNPFRLHPDYRSIVKSLEKAQENIYGLHRIINILNRKDLEDDIREVLPYLNYKRLEQVWLESNRGE